MYCSNLFIYCNIITTIVFSNASIPSHKYFFFVEMAIQSSQA